QGSEGLGSGAYRFWRHAGKTRGQVRGHRVFQIVRAHEHEVLGGIAFRLLRDAQNDFAPFVGQKSALRHFARGRELPIVRSGGARAGDYTRVLGVREGMVSGRLPTEDPILHGRVDVHGPVAIQVVLGDVEARGNFGTERR